MISRYEIPGGVTQIAKRKEINFMETLFKIVGLLIADVIVTVLKGLLFNHFLWV